MIYHDNNDDFEQWYQSYLTGCQCMPDFLIYWLQAKITLLSLHGQSIVFKWSDYRLQVVKLYFLSGQIIIKCISINTIWRYSFAIIQCVTKPCKSWFNHFVIKVILGWSQLSILIEDKDNPFQIILQDNSFEIILSGGSSKSFSRFCLLVPARHSHALRRRKNTINPLLFSLISSKYFFRLISSKKIRNKYHLPGWGLACC